MQRVMKNAAPWRCHKHSSFDTEFRQAAFGLLADLDQEASFAWDDSEHVLQAWSVARKRRARLEIEQQVAEYLEALG